MTTQALPETSTRPLLISLFALNGVTVSTLYWAQAVASVARLEFGPSVWVSMMPSATLAGYAIGVAMLAALARDLTTANGLGLHGLLLGLGLGAAAVAPVVPLIALACVLIGIGCSLTQRLLACATSAVSSSARGPVIGGIIASGLVGIVVARAIVPLASAALGWRTMFMLDAVLVCGCGVVAAIAAQRIDRRAWDTDEAALPSARTLWRREPVLRRAALRQAAVFAMFNLGWAVFPRIVAESGSSVALPMGVIASLGAGAALAAGWACKRYRPADVATVGLCAVLAVGVCALVVQGAGPLSYAAMALLDIGTQTALVANQAQGQALATTPAMRGRLAAIVTTIGFGAGAIGAAIGNALL